MKVGLGIAAAAILIRKAGVTADAGTQVLLTMGLALYFLPALIASQRGHRNASPIFILNLFFGWTLIGWVACLAWGLSHQERAAS